MRPYLVLLFASVSLAARAVEIRYRVIEPAGEIGQAVRSQRVLPDGSKYVQLRLTIPQNIGAIVVIQESTYARDGTPVRRLQTVSRQDPPLRETLAVRFTNTEAAVQIESEAARGSKKIPVKGDPRALAEFWFLRDKPKLGTAVTYSRFDLTRLEWVETLVTYDRDEKIRIGSHSVLAHVVISGDSVAYLDDEGSPYRVVTKERTLERIL